MNILDRSPPIDHAAAGLALDLRQFYRLDADLPVRWAVLIVLSPDPARWLTVEARTQAHAFTVAQDMRQRFRLSLAVSVRRVQGKPFGFWLPPRDRQPTSATPRPLSGYRPEDPSEAFGI